MVQVFQKVSYDMQSIYIEFSQNIKAILGLGPSVNHIIVLKLIIIFYVKIHQYSCHNAYPLFCIEENQTDQYNNIQFKRLHVIIAQRQHKEKMQNYFQQKYHNNFL